MPFPGRIKPQPVWPHAQQNYQPNGHYGALADHKEILSRFGWNKPSEIFPSSRNLDHGWEAEEWASLFHLLPILLLSVPVCLSKVVLILYLIKLRVVNLASIFPIHIIHLVPLLLPSMSHQDKLSYVASLPYDLILMRDFNLHIDYLSFNLRELSGILESLDLDQYVNFATCIHSRSLGLMILSKWCDILSLSKSYMTCENFSVGADLKLPINYNRTVL